jgi:hypothetical protein
MDLQDAGSRARFLIRDRDGKYPGLSGTVLTDAGITVVLSGVRLPMPADGTGSAAPSTNTGMLPNQHG